MNTSELTRDELADMIQSNCKSWKMKFAEVIQEQMGYGVVGYVPDHERNLVALTDLICADRNDLEAALMRTNAIFNY